MPQSDDLVRRFFEEHPLARFSVYTDMQAGYVRAMGLEILERLDQAISETEDGVQVDDPQALVYRNFWFWTLGAYEVVRTMTDKRSGADRCFAPDLSDRLMDLKQRVADIRMPFAKQEIRGRRQIVTRLRTQLIHHVTIAPRKTPAR